MAPQSPPGMLVPVRFKPQCTHLTMTRLYGFEFVCAVCRHPGPLGWVYCCTQDREVMIENAVAAGFPQSFDNLGEYWSSKMRIRAGSAEARVDPLSFFDEITPEQMSRYRPEQVQTILRQRDSVRDTILKDKLHHNLMPDNRIFEPYQKSLFLGTENPRPWVPSLEHECRYMVCPSCRPGAAEKSFLSLDSVAKGEVPPTSAVGYGFHSMGERPIVDVNILRSIGARPPSLSQGHHAESSENSLPESDVSLIELLEKQISSSQQHSSSIEEWRHTSVGYDGGLSHTRVAEDLSKTLKHSPGCDDLAAVFTQATEGAQKSAQERLIWTPPPSPRSHGKSKISRLSSLSFAAEESITNDYSSSSLSPQMYQITRELFRSLGHTLPQAHITYFRDLLQDKEDVHTAKNQRNMEPALGCDERTFEIACKTPLPMPNLTEQARLYDPKCTTTITEEKEGISTAGYGVAVSEESAELGIPDIIAQI